MSGTCSVTPEVYVKRKSAPDPYTAPLSRRTCKTLLELMIGAVLALFVIQFVRGFAAEHHAAVAGRIAAEARADAAEKQLAEMLKHRDQGVLLANIGPDLSGYQLRLVPQQFKGRK